jgi:hypothetical protein
VRGAHTNWDSKEQAENAGVEVILRYFILQSSFNPGAVPQNTKQVISRTFKFTTSMKKSPS